MELFLNGYKQYVEKRKDVFLIKELCSFDCDVNDIGVYGLCNQEGLFYIGRSDDCIGNRANGHLIELFKYWYLRRVGNRSARCYPSSILSAKKNRFTY